MGIKRNVLNQANQFRVADYMKANVEQFKGRTVESVRNEIAVHFGIEITATNVRTIAHLRDCEWWKTADENRDETIKQLRRDVEQLRDKVALLTAYIKGDQAAAAPHGNVA